MKANQIVKLTVAVALPLVVGGIAGFYTAEAIPGWYASLIQPSFNPPNWVFGPVWTTLYLVMGISLFMIWKLPASRQRNEAILSFLLQLVINFCWSIFFFHFKMIGLALADIVALWIMIVWTLYRFYKIQPLAAYINIPYLLWVTFATVLNASYFFLNKG